MPEKSVADEEDEMKKDIPLANFLRLLFRFHFSNANRQQYQQPSVHVLAAQFLLVHFIRLQYLLLKA